MERYDVIIIGAGIGGASLAAALASDGLDVLAVEQSEVYEDRVRGESMQPWGVAEARSLGVEKVLMDAGAHIARSWFVYHQPDLRDEIPVGMIVPGVDGSLNLRHPDACQALTDAAVAGGATVRRGVRDLSIDLGPAPVVRFRDGSGGHEVSARIVVGADGRASRVRKSLGLELERVPVLNHVAGVLLEGLVDCDEDHDFLAGEGPLLMATFHQGNGRARVYLCPGESLADRYTGPGNMERFLADCHFSCLPFGERLAKGRPVGPLATYPGDDTWVERPYGAGGVLIGDAGGYSNPIIGQGLSIALRDARMVRDVLRGDDWSPEAFEAYGDERAERMKRLRFISTLFAAIEAEDADNREARRAKWGEIFATDPRAFVLMAAIMAGPENAPEDVFDDEFPRAVRAA